MNLQYIYNSTGQTTGVFIPIEEWKKLKQKYKVDEQEDFDIPDWHLHILKERVENYNKRKEQSIDFDAAVEDIENELG